MIEKTGSRTSRGGENIFTKTWLPEGTPKANIILVHGIGEYCERYQHVAQFLTSQGYALYAFDHVGHGKSGGKRGCMSYEDAFDLIDRIKNELIASQPEIPVIVYGHSMGGGVVLAYGTGHSENVRGIIATSPAVGMANPMNKPTVAFLRFLKKIAPNMTVSNGLPQDGLSHDTQVNRTYAADPLVHDKVSVTLGLDLMDWGDRMLAYDKPYPVPLCIAQGTDDRLVDPVATDTFAKKVKGDITYKSFPGAYHELHNEPNKQELFDFLSSWLEKVIEA